MHRLAALIAATTLLGCNENGLSTLPQADVDEDPVIELDPNFVDFGQLDPGQEGVQVVTVRNIGEDVLNLDGWGYEGSDAFTFIDLDALPPRLEVGAAAAFQVRATAIEAGSLTGRLWINSDDPATPQAPLDLVAVGSGPQLTITPNPYDFHSVFVGCGDDVDLTLTNAGSADLQITDLDLDAGDGQFNLDGEPAMPLILQPGATAQVTVAFDALRAGLSDAVLEVTSNDPRGVVTAVQMAEGTYAGQRVESFTMPEDPAVDILFAIDQSCSMDTHSNNLANNFQTFIDSLGDVTSNWQIGVITQAGACRNDTVFRPHTTNLADRFAAAVALGGEHASTEQLFTLTQLALSRTVGSNCNNDVLRDDAFLHVVLVSDEYEQSSNLSAGTFVTNVWSYKDSPQQVRISGILCPNGGCPASGPTGTNAGYLQAVQQGGGEQLDILTSNWGASAQTLAEVSVDGVGRFELSGTPDLNSLSVEVDGVNQGSGWHFNSSTNEVVFDTLPAPGADIEVYYGLQVGCP